MFDFQQRKNPVRAAALAVAGLLGGTQPGMANGSACSVLNNRPGASQNSSFTEPNIFGGHWNAQTFTAPASGCLTSITFSIRRQDDPQNNMPGNLGVEIYTTVGGKPVVPLGLGGVISPLASAIVKANDVLTTFTNLQVTFTPAPVLSSGVVYALVVHQLDPNQPANINSSGGTGNAYYELGLDQTSGGGQNVTDLYPDGRFWRTPPSTWNSPPGDGERLDVAYLEVCIDESCEAPPPQPSTCQNTPGSICCGLTQGAYGNWNTSATSMGNNDCCNPIGFGLLPAGACSGANVFAPDGAGHNATTIGVPGTRAVTIGGSSSTPIAALDCPPNSSVPLFSTTTNTFAKDLLTLNAYLPASGTPKSFATSGPNAPGPDQHYTDPNQVPCQKSGGSCGNGAGTLAGQAMACGMNIFISNNVVGITDANGNTIQYPAGFTPPGLDQFTLPSVGTLLCTKRSGPDKTLGTGDDICQAFSYPSCVAGKTVAQVKACADQALAGSTNDCGCTPSQLNDALNNINVQFDQCGQVIECGLVAAPGVFTCPSQ